MSGLSWFRRPTPAERLAYLRLRPDTARAAAAMASDARSDRDVKRLESLLSDSEVVLRMMDGRYEGDFGLLVLTSERVLFQSRTMFGPARFSIPVSAVRAVAAHTHRLSGTVIVTTDDDQLTVDKILGVQGEWLADDLRTAMHGGSSSAPARDPLEVLAELRAMRDAGLVTDAEFELRKGALWRDI